MNQVQVIVHRQARVLTTGQLAESYGTDVKVISNNFTRNADRYTEGKHFIRLTGEELKAFKAIHQIDENLKFASVLYLWTEKGAWLHAKSLNADAAWDAYEMLVDEYYNIQETLTAEQQAREHLKMSIMTSERVDQIAEVVNEVKTEVNQLKDSIHVTSSQAKAIRKKVGDKVYESLGGKESNAFKNMKSKVFSACWRDFKNYFDINEFRDLPKLKFEDGMKFLFMWQPNTELRMEIEHYNSQLQLKLVK